MPPKRVCILSPVFLIRLGLGLVFIYAGVYKLFDPASWAGFIPHWFTRIISGDVFLPLLGVFELILGVMLILRLYLALVSLLAFSELFIILLVYGISDTTFRDFGLLMATLALFLMCSREN